MRKTLFAVLLIILPITSSLCIDMYLPAYGYIATSFHVREGFIDISMSVYLFGLAVGQLIYGPCADRFGRKAALMPGLAIFTFASMLCAISNDIEFFLAARMLQAIGACSTIVLCRTIVADSFHPEKRTQMLALISATNIFSPALAPLLGGFITTFYTWRMIFFVISGAGIVLLFASSILIAETINKSDPSALSGRTQFTNLKRIFTDHTYTGFVLCLSFLYATVFVWVTLSPSLLLDHFGVHPDRFGWYFLLPAIGSCSGALVTAKFSQYFDSIKWIRFGLFWLFSVVICFVLAYRFIHSPDLLVLFIVFLFFGTGLTTPQLISDSIGRFVNIGGFASGILGFVQTSFGGIMGVIASHFYVNSIDSIAYLMLAPVALAILAYFYAIYLGLHSALEPIKH